MIRRCLQMIRVLPVLSLFLVLGGCSDDGASSNQNNNNENSVGVCGDGQVDVGEQCDDGEDNSDLAPDACRTDCRDAFCGDGAVDSGEECDEAGANSDLTPGACRRICVFSHCGDGVLDPEEACDDGNSNPDDGCSGACAVDPFWQCQGVPSVCTCIDHRSGPSCGDCVVYVDVNASSSVQPDGLTWPTAFKQVQPAIDAAAEAGPLCEVWVARGTYHVWDFAPSNTINLLSNVLVFGGFDGTETARQMRDWQVNETILDGADPDNPSLRGVLHVISAQVSFDATVSGFTITGGIAMGLSSVNRSGGGLLSQGSMIWVNQCRFEGNEALAEKGGGGMLAVNSSVSLSDVVFSNNTGGGLQIHSSEFTVNDATFIGNEEASAMTVTMAIGTVQRVAFLDNDAADHVGGAIDFQTARTEISDSVFENNRTDLQGGAIRSQDASTVIVACTFRDNVAHSGGAIHGENGLVMVTNSTFWNNAATTGGAISFEAEPLVEHFHSVMYSVFSENSSTGTNTGEGGSAIAAKTFSNPVIANCTLWGNSAAGSAHGALLVDSPNTTIINSILWNNTPNDANIVSSAGMVLVYSDIGSMTFAYPPSVINTNPNFVNPAMGNFELQAGSPCIDTGMIHPDFPTVDILGQPHVDILPAETDGSFVDMGAYEFHP